MPAILPYTRRMVFLETATWPRSRATAPPSARLDGTPVHASRRRRSTWDPVSAAKGGYKHFMLKEIHEQPRSVTESLAGRLDPEPATSTSRTCT